MLPDMFRNGIRMMIVHLPSHIVDCSIDHYPPDPSDQQHLQLFNIPHLEPAEVPEHFQECIMRYFYRLLIRIHITECYFQTKPVVLVIQRLLALTILVGTPANNMKQFFQNLADLPEL